MGTNKDLSGPRLHLCMNLHFDSASFIFIFGNDNYESQFVSLLVSPRMLFSLSEQKETYIISFYKSHNINLINLLREKKQESFSDI